MPNQPRILTVIGTRPEAIKMAPVVRALQQLPGASVRVLATGQHRQLLAQALAFFGIAPDRDLDLMQPGQSLSELTARMLSALTPVLQDEQPDLVLAQGDTTTVLVTALACFYQSVPFAHVEAGLRSGDLQNPFPEEMNRTMADRMACLHFAPTEAAAANLIREGIAQGSVHVTGNTVIDALLWASDKVSACPFAQPGKRLILVTSHRRENFGPALESICAAVRELADRPDTHVLFPVHPNPNVGDTVRSQLGSHPSIELVPPLDYPELVAAMNACDLILTDSGGIQEEAPSLGKPVLILRTNTERPEGIAQGSAKLVGTERATIVDAANALLDDAHAYASMAQKRSPYGDGHAAVRIATACRDYLGSK